MATDKYTYMWCAILFKTNCMKFSCKVFIVGFSRVIYISFGIDLIPL